MGLLNRILEESMSEGIKVSPENSKKKTFYPLMRKN